MKDSTDNLIVSSEQTPDAAAPVLSAGERHKLLIEWNQTQRDYPRDKCIHQLFEEQGERAPDAVAVVFEGSSLTYRELNARANQVAQHLRSLGVGPEILVGIWVERSMGMIIGLLAVLKAGGAFVPITPDLPMARLAFLMEDAQLTVLLTQEPLRAKLPPTAARIVCLDCLPALPEATSADGPQSGVTLENLAYVIYTSGSTGRPKGVLIPHKALLSYCFSAKEWWQLGAADRVLHFVTFSFDVSIDQILSPLLAGATVFIRGTERWEPAQLSKAITEHGLTVVGLPPAYWQQWVESLDRCMVAKMLGSLRLVVLGGDAVPIVPVARWQEVAGATVRLVNAYGPTEATVFATAYELPAQWPDGVTPKRVSIGRPLSNRTAYILDPLGNPVPVGVVGELYLGGEGLARGYQHQPELTAERFVPDLFSGKTGARLYRTGDLARYLPDGNLDFLGRTDFQVKVRGFRIELGEIETVLDGHPEVAACAVMAQEPGGGEKVLVAFVVGRGRAAPSVESLRLWLMGRLPDYMIPSRFLAVPALPLNSNGKVDRKALRSLDGAELASGIDYVAPRNAREAELADIWQVVLRRERVGIHDDFFALGGHSLLAVRMLSRVHDATGVMPTLGRFFAHPRIQNLSTFIEEEKVRLSIEGGGSPRIGDEQTPLFLLKNALNLKSAGLGDRRYYVIPFPDCTSSMAQCRVEFLAEQCLEKLRTIQPHGPYILVGHSLPGLVAYEMACRLCAEGEEVPLVVIIDTTPATFLERMAPALIGSVGARLRLPFQLQLFLAGVWFYANNRLRRFRHVPGPQWRRGWRELRNDLARIKAIWRSKRNRPAPMLGGHVLQTKSAPARSLLGLDGFTSQSPLVWTSNAFKPKPYAGCVALFLAEATAFESSTPGCGWKQWTSRLQEYSLPGDHVSCVTQHKDVLVEKLLRCLATVENKIPK